MAKTVRELEAEISTAVIRFEKEFLGRGPLETKTYVLGDVVLVRLKNVLTPAEVQMIGDEPGAAGRGLIKEYRRRLIESGRGALEEAVRGVLGVPVLSFHTDLSTKTGERVIVFTLAGAPALPAPKGAKKDLPGR